MRECLKDGDGFLRLMLFFQDFVQIVFIIGLRKFKKKKNLENKGCLRVYSWRVKFWNLVFIWRVLGNNDVVNGYDLSYLINIGQCRKDVRELVIVCFRVVFIMVDNYQNVGNY